MHHMAAVAAELEARVRLIAEHADSGCFTVSAEFTAALEKLSVVVARGWQATLPTLAANGWCVDNGLSPAEARSVVDLFESGDAAAANGLLQVHFEEGAGRILDEVRGAFPSRKRLVASALTAHRQRRYSLAIPLLLAQADGICADAMQRSLFIRKTRADISEQLPRGDSEWDAVVSPIANLGVLVAPTYGRVVGPGELNRHAILHGLVTDYGTRLNSAKAISLLGYIVMVMSEHQSGRTAG